MFPGAEVEGGMGEWGWGGTMSRSDEGLPGSGSGGDAWPSPPLGRFTPRR